MPSPEQAARDIPRKGRCGDVPAQQDRNVSAACARDEALSRDIFGSPRCLRQAYYYQTYSTWTSDHVGVTNVADSYAGCDDRSHRQLPQLKYMYVLLHVLYVTEVEPECSCALLTRAPR